MSLLLLLPALPAILLQPLETPLGLDQLGYELIHVHRHELVVLHRLRHSAIQGLFFL